MKVSILLFLIPALSFAGPLDEPRYCLPIVRNESGDIVRSSAVIRSFKKFHPCPVTGLSAGTCPGWQVDHVIPLACGGCDHVSNLQWLPEVLKTAAVVGKDRFERKIYGLYPGTSCTAPPL